MIQPLPYSRFEKWCGEHERLLSVAWVVGLILSGASVGIGLLAYIAERAGVFQ